MTLGRPTVFVIIVQAAAVCMDGRLGLLSKRT
jgi:hypothetical protein